MASWVPSAPGHTGQKTRRRTRRRHGTTSSHSVLSAIEHRAPVRPGCLISREKNMSCNTTAQLPPACLPYPFRGPCQANSPRQSDPIRSRRLPVVHFVMSLVRMQRDADARTPELVQAWARCSGPSKPTRHPTIVTGYRGRGRRRGLNPKPATRGILMQNDCQ